MIKHEYLNSRIGNGKEIKPDVVMQMQDELDAKVRKLDLI